MKALWDKGVVYKAAIRESTAFNASASIPMTS